MKIKAWNYALVLGVYLALQLLVNFEQEREQEAFQILLNSLAFLCLGVFSYKLLKNMTKK